MALTLADISKDIEHLLSKEGKKTLSLPKVETLVGQLNGENYIVKIFAYKTASRVFGAATIAHMINNLSLNYKILGILSPPVQVQLMPFVNSMLNININIKKQFTTMVYLAVDEESGRRIDAVSLACKESGTFHTLFEETEEIIQVIIANGMRDLDKEDI